MNQIILTKTKITSIFNKKNMDDKIISREQSLADKDVLVEKYKTALKKAQFINEVKNGLGDEIKKNPKPKVIKKSFTSKIISAIKKVFTKF
jgi:hypothetical protein